MKPTTRFIPAISILGVTSTNVRLEKVPGVKNAKATYEPKEAVVTFDDTKTSVEKLQEATKNAGFPSSLKSGK